MRVVGVWQHRLTCGVCRAGCLRVLAQSTRLQLVVHQSEVITNTNCCLYTVDPPDDEQQACSKHVEAYYWNKLTENSASCWFMLYGYITMHRQEHIKFFVLFLILY
jgi:hypothetical protein